MAVLQVTSRQFREKQKNYFELADKGEKIIIKRREKQAYLLTPINDEDLYFTPEMKQKIELSLQQVKEGKVITTNTKEELQDFLNSI